MSRAGGHKAAGAAALMLAGLAGLPGCAATPAAGTAEAPVPAGSYLGIEAARLDDSLVQFSLRMGAPAGPESLRAYGDCAAAGYALARGHGFARHVRTQVQEDSGLWRADAVYTISPALPRGWRTIDAEVVADACAENGIPTV